MYTTQDVTFMQERACVSRNGAAGLHSHVLELKVSHDKLLKLATEIAEFWKDEGLSVNRRMTT